MHFCELNFYSASVFQGIFESFGQSTETLMLFVSRSLKSQAKQESSSEESLEML